MNVPFTNLLPFNGDFSFKKARSCREPNLDCRSADRPGWCDVLPKSMHESCRMGRRIVVMKLICSLGHFECDGHTVQAQSTASHDWLDPRESDCSRMRSKVSFDWLPSYIKATRPILEIFKVDRYFLDSPRTKKQDRFLWTLCSRLQLNSYLNM